MNNLKALRKAAGLTQFQLAMKSGVSRFRTGMAESEGLELRADEIEAITNAVRPGIEQIVRLASAFQIQARIADG